MPPSELAKLSRRERQIVDILYEQSACSAHDIKQRLADPPSYSTVRALLARMVEKKLIAYKNVDGKYIYSTVVTESVAQTSAIARLLKIFFKGSRVKAVNALLEKDAQSLTDREIKELERTISRVKQVQRNNSTKSE